MRGKCVSIDDTKEFISNIINNGAVSECPIIIKNVSWGLMDYIGEKIWREPYDGKLSCTVLRVFYSVRNTLPW